MSELAISAIELISHHLPLTRYHRMVAAVESGKVWRYGEDNCLHLRGRQTSAVLSSPLWLCLFIYTMTKLDQLISHGFFQL